jgi:hypothetical protein
MELSTKINPLPILFDNSIAAFIITRGRDNVQYIAGESTLFWPQLGLVFGKFPLLAGEEDGMPIRRCRT